MGSQGNNPIAMLTQLLLNPSAYKDVMWFIEHFLKSLAATLLALELDGAGVDGKEGRDEGAHCRSVF